MFNGKRIKELEEEVFGYDLTPNDLYWSFTNRKKPSLVSRFNSHIKDSESKMLERISRIVDMQRNFANTLTGIQYENKAVVDALKAENSKLKAVVAELCDYIYADRSSK